MAASKQDRIFNHNGRRHYRRTYSLGEARMSGVVLAALALIGAWIWWLGAHPDPELFSVSSTLLATGSEAAPARARKLATGTAPDREIVDRGPVPDGLTANGWREQGLAYFDADNVYEKINGRAGYYKSFGFQRLYFISLVHERSESTVIDIEMYDQGTVANALGAYAGERRPDASPRFSSGSISHMDRNALFLVRGRYYVRFIGSAESDLVKQQLAHLEGVFAASLPGEALPWAYALFAGQMGLDPGKISYARENGFSFSFARHVYSAEIDDDGAALFVIACRDESAATALAAQFTRGFLSLGSRAGDNAGVTWVKERYLDTLTGVATSRSLVIGVHRAPDLPFAQQMLAKLENTVAGLPAEVLTRAAAERETGGGAGAATSKAPSEADEYQANENQANENQANENQAGENQAGENQAGEYEAGEYEAGEYEAGEYEAGEYEAGEYETGEYEAGEYEAGTGNGDDESPDAPPDAPPDAVTKPLPVEE